MQLLTQNCYSYVHKNMSCLWQSRKTAIMTTMVIPIPRPITMNSFTSVSFTPEKLAMLSKCCSKDSNTVQLFLQLSSSDLSSRPQLCWWLHLRLFGMQKYDVVHWNPSQFGPSFISVQVALKPLDPTALSAMKNLKNQKVFDSFLTII